MPWLKSPFERQGFPGSPLMSGSLARTILPDPAVKAWDGQLSDSLSPSLPDFGWFHICGGPRWQDHVHLRDGLRSPGFIAGTGTGDHPAAGAWGPSRNPFCSLHFPRELPCSVQSRRSWGGAIAGVYLESCTIAAAGRQRRCR